jgi:SCY1-like protein 1
VLPALVSALEFGGEASAPTIVPLMLRLGARVPPAEYSTAVLTPVLALYARPDRAVRMALLDALPEYADKLDKKSVNDKIWPHLVGSLRRSTDSC